MHAKLLVTKGETVVREVKLKATTTVGRSKDSDLCIRSSLVSRDHCVVFEQDGTLVVKDLGSTNGTLVNGNAVSEQVLLPGDELTIGPVNFRVTYKTGPTTSPMAPVPPPLPRRAESPVSAPLDDDDETLLAEEVGPGQILQAKWVEDDGEDEVLDAVALDVVDQADGDDKGNAGAAPIDRAAAIDEDDDDDGLGELFARLRNDG